MTRKSQSMPAALNIVMAAVTMAERIQALPTLRLTPSVSPAPYRWEVNTVKPVVSPCIKPRIRKEMVPVAPTAASACTPTNCPTITVSATLYIC